MSSVQQLYPTDSSFTFGPGLLKKMKRSAGGPILRIIRTFSSGATQALGQKAN